MNETADGEVIEWPAARSPAQSRILLLHPGCSGTSAITVRNRPLLFSLCYVLGRSFFCFPTRDDSRRPASSHYMMCGGQHPACARRGTAVV